MPLFFPVIASLPLLLAQVGPFTPSTGAPATQLPPEILDREHARRKYSPPVTTAMPQAPQQAEGCIAEVTANPAKGAELAQKAMDQAQGEERVRAGLCLGVALSELDRFVEAENAFIHARDAAAPDDAVTRARLGGMAGNAALAAARLNDALPILAAAGKEAQTAGDNALAGSIAADRARVLVAMGKNDDAAAALAEARQLAPQDEQAWLLSATLSRRMDMLADAQAQIETAVRLQPDDPEIGLEAGVIAMLAGHSDAARKSWQSVVATAPDSAAGATARQYLAQLGPESAAQQPRP